MNSIINTPHPEPSPRKRGEGEEVGRISEEGAGGVLFPFEPGLASAALPKHCPALSPRPVGERARVRGINKWVFFLVLLIFFYLVNDYK